MKKLKEPILAEGEVTGHAHRLLADVDVFETDEETRIFDLNEYTILTHEEHGPITLPPGEFESDKVIEFDQFDKQARKVRD